MRKTSLGNLLHGIAAEYRSGAHAETSVSGICTDSRVVSPGDLFVALRGEKQDGHLFVDRALEAGAAAALVERSSDGVFAGPAVVVEDALRALGDMASNYRRMLPAAVAGITGSIGKTSVKEMAAAVLETQYCTAANRGNFNNEIGVPLTLFSLDETTEVALVEMGMRGAGQIDLLARIAEPSVGLITTIGYAHLELLGSRAAIAAAKAELIARLPAGGTAILPRHDDYFDYLKSRVPAGVRLLTFSVDPGLDADVHAEPDGEQGFRVRVGGATEYGRLSVIGEHHWRNTAAAVALGIAFGVPVEQSVKALERWTGAPGRMVLREGRSGALILDDCYNAGPESVRSALRSLAAYGARGRVAILGDMRELGEQGIELHRSLAASVVAAKPRLLITVGALAQHIAYALAEHGAAGPSHIHFDDSIRASEMAANLVEPTDVALVKGSRAMEMEKIVAALMGASEGEVVSHG